MLAANDIKQRYRRATHDDNLVRELSRTAIWMNYGRVASMGDTETVLAQYHSEIG
jgi:ABC-type polysaccharide/polyol phosphate transport system ATPase subunit